jgi:ankyrin repeat protein
MKATLLLLVFSVARLGADMTPGEMFWTAAAHGDLNAIESLLAAGFNPNAPVRDGQTPLSTAMLLGQPELVRLLLAWHADPNQAMDTRTKMNSDKPLHYAARNGNLRMAATLLAGGAEIDARGNAGRTALHLAVVGGHLDLIPFLIEKGANVNSRDADGASPLDRAIERGSLDAVALLLAHGARLNESDAGTGATPVNQAAANGNIHLVQYLLQFHPDLAIPDKRDNSPLDNAIRSGQEDVVVSVLEAGPAPGLGKAMEAATRKDEARVVEALLRQGAPVDGILPSGYTPLDTAAFAGAIKVAGVLLDGKANPDLTGRDGTAPIEDASEKGFESIVRMLLDHGAKSGAALYAAASIGHMGVVKLLLERGANASVCGPNRKTPYQAAVDGGYDEVAALIRTHGGETGCFRP